MSHTLETITISISPDIAHKLNHYAAEQHIPAEEVAVDLLSQALNLKKHDVFRVVQNDRTGQSGYTDPEPLREIIQRQDEEITWLRDQMSRLSSLTPTTHIIRHEFPAISTDLRENPVIPECEDIKKSQKSEEIKSQSSDAILPPHISVEDVLYKLPETGMEPEELITSGFSGSERVGERTLRDSIGGVREEKDYSVSEAAAIAGESESILLEYITNGFLPAKQDGKVYRIQGIDLRRYMMSK